MLKNKNLNSILVGLFILLFGTGLLLGQFSIINFESVLGTFWPLCIIAFAVSRFVVKDWKGGVVLTFFGVVAQLNSLNILNVNIWSLIWPLIIILVGFSILRKGFVFDRREDKKDYINESTIFGGIEKHITSDTFKGGNILTLFGGTNIDLTKSKIDKEGANLDLTVLFGGADIIVKNDMYIDMDVIAIFGGNSDKQGNPTNEKVQNTLRIRGIVLFGGLEIKRKA